MYNVLLDLDVAEVHRHEMETYAAHERLAMEAVRASKEAGEQSLVDRLLKTLKIARRPSDPSDRRLN